MDRLLLRLAGWLDSHPDQVVIINFGNIEYPASTVPAIMETVGRVFSNQSSAAVRLNTGWQRTGQWPTLGQVLACSPPIKLSSGPTVQAVAGDERVVVLLRDTVAAITPAHTQFIREVKVKPGEEAEPETGNLTVTVTSSYKVAW